MEQLSNGTTVTVPDAFIHKDRAVTALIFGIVSLLTAFLPVLSVAGIVFGALAVAKGSKNRHFANEKAIPENGMNVAGFVMGLIGLILSAIMTLVYLFAIAAAFFVIANVSTDAISSATAAITVPGIEIPAITVG